MSKAVEELTYEEACAELEAIVTALETGQQTLEEALTLFERGQALLQHCASLLERADLKVRQLAGEDLTEFQNER